MNDNFLLTRI